MWIGTKECDNCGKALILDSHTGIPKRCTCLVCCVDYGAFHEGEQVPYSRALDYLMHDKK